MQTSDIESCKGPKMHKKFGKLFFLHFPGYYTYLLGSGCFVKVGDIKDNAQLDQEDTKEDRHQEIDFLAPK